MLATLCMSACIRVNAQALIRHAIQMSLDDRGIKRDVGVSEIGDPHIVP